MRNFFSHRIKISDVAILLELSNHKPVEEYICDKVKMVTGKATTTLIVF